MRCRKVELLFSIICVSFLIECDATIWGIKMEGRISKTLMEDCINIFAYQSEDFTLISTKKVKSWSIIKGKEEKTVYYFNGKYSQFFLILSNDKTFELSTVQIGGIPPTLDIKKKIEYQLNDFINKIKDKCNLELEKIKKEYIGSISNSDTSTNFKSVINDS